MLDGNIIVYTSRTAGDFPEAEGARAKGGNPVLAFAEKPVEQEKDLIQFPHSEAK